MTLQELFPGCDVTRDKIRWYVHDTGEYVHAYKGQDATLDGDFTSAQLRALADWLDEEVKPR
jgi:hypothetical protein